MKTININEHIRRDVIMNTPNACKIEYSTILYYIINHFNNIIHYNTLLTISADRSTGYWRNPIL